MRSYDREEPRRRTPTAACQAPRKGLRDVAHRGRSCVPGFSGTVWSCGPVNHGRSGPGRRRTGRSVLRRRCAATESNGEMPGRHAAGAGGSCCGAFCGGSRRHNAGSRRTATDVPGTAAAISECPSAAGAGDFAARFHQSDGHRWPRLLCRTRSGDRRRRGGRAGLRHSSRGGDRSRLPPGGERHAPSECRAVSRRPDRRGPFCMPPR